MKIARDNYEAFFLDYLEGKLEETMIDELLDFLETNPDLKEELYLFEHLELPVDQAVFTGKAHLYKPVAEDKAAFEIKSVALIEGDLKGEERQLFEQILASDPGLQKEYRLMTQTRLVADTNIKYPYKRKLYKKSATLIWLDWPRLLGGVAALVLIFWGIQSLLQTESQTREITSSPEVASVTPLGDPLERKIETSNIMESETDQKIGPKARITPRTGPPPTIVKPHSIASAAPVAVDRDLSVLEEINPLVAQLEPDRIETQLVDLKPGNAEKTDDPRNVMTLSEFVASRAQKAGGEGLLSVNRILRFGLNVASELSGDRVGFKEKNGKISSLDFETRLMAFSIPLQKE